MPINPYGKDTVIEDESLEHFKGRDLEFSNLFIANALLHLSIIALSTVLFAVDGATVTSILYGIGFFFFLFCICGILTRVFIYTNTLAYKVLSVLGVIFNTYLIFYMSGYLVGKELRVGCIGRSAFRYLIVTLSTLAPQNVDVYLVYVNYYRMLLVVFLHIVASFLGIVVCPFGCRTCRNRTIEDSLFSNSDTMQEISLHSPQQLRDSPGPQKILEV